jgi:hypothetical protein
MDERNLTKKRKSNTQEMRRKRETDITSFQRILNQKKTHIEIVDIFGQRSCETCQGKKKRTTEEVGN